MRSGTRITVHGDYDVDGICSTAVLVRALRALGADVDWYLPDRASDGYGLNAKTVRRLGERGTRLLLTADCGITAVEEVDLARTLGIEVVVSDHHSPRADGALPRAPIVHPAVCGYPCSDLCATAVAYKLALALCEGVDSAGPPIERSLTSQAAAHGAGDGHGSPGARYDPHEDLDLVALATIADVVPLLGENRALVRRGLRALAGTAKPGLRALLAVARSSAGEVNERTVGFALAPRLNAAGRMHRADAGLELILTEDPARAREIAAELDRANHERRHVETRILFDAERQVAALGERAGYVLAGEEWHPGVIGIVASRLAERHHRPFVLIALEGAAGRSGDAKVSPDFGRSGDAQASPVFGRGSGRSIAGFDLLGALDACAGHLVRHGGHRSGGGPGDRARELGGVRRGVRGSCRAGPECGAAGGERARGRGRGGRGAGDGARGGAADAGAVRACATRRCRCWCGARGSPIAERWGKAGTCVSRCSRTALAPVRWPSAPARACRCATGLPRTRRSRWRSTSGGE